MDRSCLMQQNENCKAVASPNLRYNMTWLVALMIFAGFTTTCAHAASPARFLISDLRQQGDHLQIVIVILNDGEDQQSIALPERVEARVETADSARVTWAHRIETGSEHIVVSPASYGRAIYILPSFNAPDTTNMSISIPAWETVRAVVKAENESLAREPLELASTPSPSLNSETRSTVRSSADRSSGNAFLNNLSAYEPVYITYGPGTDTEARIQFSFKYQLFGRPRSTSNQQSLLDGLHFAYSQRMFWDLDAQSSPFRNIDFQPELFYLTPVETLPNNVSLSAQGGIRHESNGRSGADSRSLNTIYLAPMATALLGDGYRISVAPRLAVYVGDLSDNPDIQRYRGNLSLAMELGHDEGLLLSTHSRYNFSSGKGAFSADLSYPLQRIIGGAPNFYLFGQGFFGYGENLLDYERNEMRLRAGLAIVR